MFRICLILLLSFGSSVEATPYFLQLPIGDEQRREQQMPVVVDGIVDTRNGDVLTVDQLAKRLADTRLLFVGESHTDIDFHRVQLRILQALHRSGRQVLIGLEMFPATEQHHLDAWVDGHYSEDGFLELADWYGNWGYPWGYYRDIFLFAQQAGLPMFAVNAPRSVIKAVRVKGFEGLDDDEKSYLPPSIDITSEQHRTLFKSYFDEDDPLHSQMTEEQWDGMIRAQATWDAAMGYNSLQALEEFGSDNAILVVLIGSGHVAYGLGIERQTSAWFDGGMASVIPIRVESEDEELRVRASYSDYLWGLPPATDPLYPPLGISTQLNEPSGRKVIYVSEETPAAKAGIQIGDVVHSFNGVALDDNTSLDRLMAEKRWGDAATLGIQRGDQQLDLPVFFRRQSGELATATSITATSNAATQQTSLADAAHAADLPHHQLKVELDPTTHQLRVTNHWRPAVSGSANFALHAGLEITSSEPPVERLGVEQAEAGGINTASDQGGVEVTRYQVQIPADGEVVLSYEGTMEHGLSDAKEEYTRGFRDTQGLVDDRGVYLAGASAWYPQLDDGLVSFELSAAVPEGWHLISQGKGISRDEADLAHWQAEGPMDEIYLVGGPLKVYRDTAGAVETLVYLRERDDALASKYLTTTAQYLEMYRGLISPYPYSKFALVENFWETGYGMPSFTLLGPTIIRFPFILHSSYPHEILHNWWGNSVFVDYDTGNWCEGLTAYMADHLVQEQRGKGAEYRRGVLQKYRDFVKDGRDFPLREFRSRHSAATEAVGYGKTLMGFHMLRRHLGDENFMLALRRFYRGYKGKKAAFEDLRAAFEDVGQEDYSRFFSDWVERPGAADLAIENVEVRSLAGEGFEVTGSLHQRQEGGAFLLAVPVRLETASGATTHTVLSEHESSQFTLHSAERPVALEIDPEFDVFRQLDPRETPPSIGQLFGEPEILALLPSQAGEPAQEHYRQLLTAWQSDSHQIDIRLDSDVEELPTDRAVWLLGRNNTWTPRLFTAATSPGVEIDAEGLTIEREHIPFADHSLVWIRRHPQNLEKAIGWLVTEPAAAFPGMARKLPHYGKYSYLGFQGDEPTNVVKGQWPANDSPLRIVLNPHAKDNAQPGAASASAGEERQALAELPPVFSARALMEHVHFLAAPGLEGRGATSQGARQAAEYIAHRFEQAGLKPLGDGGSFLQSFQIEGPDGQTHEVVNVLGYMPGSRPDWAQQSAVISAHYDHLGRGWPDAYAGNSGEIHPGADDNASGVAVLLELVKNVADGDKPARNLVFAAFGAEEAGRLGSRHYVEQPPFPLDQTLGIINLDTIGRLGNQPVQILGTGTADEWQHIFRGCSFVTGVDSKNIPGSAEGSDQWSFIERGVPGVQIFTGAHQDYHRPSDTADKVDAPGLVKLATFLKEAVVYMGERDRPFNSKIARVGAAGTSPPPTNSGERRVRFGSVPDFAYPGPGVRLDGVTEGSPAAVAGLQAGDILTHLGTTKIASLRTFSDVLKTLNPGQTITARATRDGQALTFEVTVDER